MSTTNPVNQVLVTTGDQALLAAGNRPDALAIGQLGVFNYHTGLSIDGTVLPDTPDVYIAVGADPFGVGSLQDINRSSGQCVQVRNMKSLTFKGFTAGLPKIVDITDFRAVGDTGYQLKIELRNAETYALNGYSQLTKTFNAYTSPVGRVPIGGYANELAIAMVRNINILDWLVIASLINSVVGGTVTAASVTGNTTVTIGSTSYIVAVLSTDTAAQTAVKIAAAVNAANVTANIGQSLTVVGAVISINNAATGTVFTASGSGVTIGTITTTKTVITDSNAFIAANPGTTLGIRLTSFPSARKLYDSINVSYMKNRDTDMFVSLLDGLTGNGVATTVQELQKLEGSGYDLRQIEYMAGGFNGKPGPYRVSETTGLARAGIIYNASLSVNYNQFVLTYDQIAVAGWLMAESNLETILAVPCGSATTLSSIATIFDLIFTRFGGMANDIAANGDCTNVRTGLLTPATDGIESIS